MVQENVYLKTKNKKIKKQLLILWIFTCMALVIYISIINIDFVSKQSKPIDGYSVFGESILLFVGHQRLWNASTMLGLA